jgi:hypothetical protein
LSGLAAGGLARRRLAAFACHQVYENRGRTIWGRGGKGHQVIEKTDSYGFKAMRLPVLEEVTFS